MQVSRRAMMLALAATPVAACTRLDRELGSHLDEGAFGNPTAHNILVQTGQLPFVINLAERFAAEVPDTVTFAFNSARLSGEAEAILRRQAAWIRQFPEVTFRVFGHTDLVGSDGYNRRLGLRRARTVVAYLIRQGADRSRLEAVISEGETQPLINTAEREQQNRRAVTEVSGFWQRHPTVLRGQYAAIINREYVDSAIRERPAPYR